MNSLHIYPPASVPCFSIDIERSSEYCGGCNAKGQFRSQRSDLSTREKAWHSRFCLSICFECFSGTDLDTGSHGALVSPAFDGYFGLD
ncbi:hypothetical [Prochlorococcus marinus str. MIT 9313]|uniref:Uncharacterized protein n=1 Tax=Prochlorococcus marinus (strain MIT 9313) TaxID=74547 RepID=Q7V7A4_PROMM|nr:hypothetical [Prochlorococcus marinus str. MIT 9313]